MGENGPANPAHDLPAHVLRARREGRYTPGRGPWYCSRILPTAVPVLRQTLLDTGTTRWKVDNSYVALLRGVVMERAAIPDGDYGAYRACGICRARAWHLVHPTFVIGGWQAAAYHGLPYWADDAPVVMYTDDRVRGGATSTVGAAAAPFRAVVRALPAGFDLHRDTVTPDPAFPRLRVMSAPVALAQCLRSVLSGEHGWWVSTVPGLTWRTVRAVQLIDAVAQCTTVTWSDLESAAKGLVSRRTLRQLERLVSVGAESPRETELRLFVRDMLPPGCHWRTQLPVSYRDVQADGSVKIRRTFLDLGCPELRLGLYYDGKHHEGDDQTEKDFAQLQDLGDERWTVIRVNKDLMKNTRKMLAQIGSAIDRAVGSAP
jgi:very-short-patch-repair endonuclease